MHTLPFFQALSMPPHPRIPVFVFTTLNLTHPTRKVLHGFNVTVTQNMMHSW